MTNENVLPFAFLDSITDKSKASCGVIDGSFIIKMGAAKYLSNRINDIIIPKIVSIFPIAQTEDAQYGIEVLNISYVVGELIATIISEGKKQKKSIAELLTNIRKLSDKALKYSLPLPK